MARTYSPKSFLRHVRNDLLARYFQDRGLLQDVDIAVLAEHAVTPILEALMALPGDARLAVESDFREVDDLAHEAGIQTLIEEGRFREIDLEPPFADLDGFHDKALLALMEAPDVFEIAARFSYADRRPKRYWSRLRGLPRIAPADDPAACRRLANEMSTYLRVNEGRGYLCESEVYLRQDRHYFFALPEDYAVTNLEFSGGHLERRKLRPAFEVIFVYCRRMGTLDVYFEGSRKKIAELQQIFSRTILLQELPAIPGQERVFQLNQLKRRGFPFLFDPASGIVDVRIMKLRLTSLDSRRRRTLEVDPHDGRDAIWDMIDETFETGRRQGSSGKVPLNAVNITQVGLRVEFAPGRGRRTRTFDVTYPNLCPLDHDGRDGVIRQMLIDSGIEPHFDDEQLSA